MAHLVEQSAERGAVQQALQRVPTHREVPPTVGR